MEKTLCLQCTKCKQSFIFNKGMPCQGCGNTEFINIKTRNTITDREVESYFENLPEITKNKWVCSKNLKFINKSEYCFIAGRSYDETVEDRTTEENKFMINEQDEIHSVTSVGWFKYFTKL